MQIEEMEACTKKMTEATKGIGQRDIKGAADDCFIFESCFSSNKSAKDSIGVGADMIGTIKTNKKVFWKYTIDKLTNNCPGGSNLMLRRNYMVPRNRPLIAIGLKYNAQKVLYLIVTEDAGSKNAGITYLSK